MNWLAHLYFSDPSPEFRVGSILPDIAPPSALEALPPEYQRGIQMHRQIDAFTDAHPRFRQSVQRLPDRFRRYGGVLIDIYYDHFLARDWESYSDTPLTEFAAEVYAAFSSHESAPALPAAVQLRLEQIRNADLLCSYRKVEGVSQALKRMNKRLRRPFDLSAAIPALQEKDAAFHDDFNALFPELQSHLEQVSSSQRKPGKP